MKNAVANDINYNPKSYKYNINPSFEISIRCVSNARKQPSHALQSHGIDKLHVDLLELDILFS